MKQIDGLAKNVFSAASFPNLPHFPHYSLECVCNYVMEAQSHIRQPFSSYQTCCRYVTANYILMVQLLARLFIEL